MSILNDKAARELWKKGMKNFWQEFRQNTMGVVGLAVLLIFTLLAVFGPLFVSTSGQVSELDMLLLPPSSSHWLGTDDMGKDVFLGLIEGARVSMMVGVTATLMSVVIGTVIGITAGYYGGGIDAVLMRLTDVFFGDTLVALDAGFSSLIRLQYLDDSLCHWYYQLGRYRQNYPLPDAKLQRTPLCGESQGDWIQ